MIFRAKYIISTLVFFLFTINSYSQNNYSVEQLINDVQRQQFDNPIRYGQDIINKIEQGFGSQYGEADYIGVVSMLSNVYISSGNYNLADAILNRAISFLSSARYYNNLNVLFWEYGVLYYSMSDYHNAEIYISEALKSMSPESEGAEPYSVVLSTLSECHRNLNQFTEAKREIDYAISLSENTKFSYDNIIPLYQKASGIYYELGIIDTAILFAKKAYNLSEENGHYLSGYYYSANGLAVMLSDQRKYRESLKILHKVEKRQLTDIQRANLFINIFQNNYHLNNEKQTAKYAILCSNLITKNTLSYFYQLPLRETEHLWNADALQLRVNMGVLDKFPRNDELVGMCYNNVLFVKTLSYEHSSLIKQLANNKQSEKTLDKIQELKERIFAGEDTLFNELDLYEKVLLNQLNGSSLINNFSIATWDDVQRTLKKGECAIEMISYVGFPASVDEEKELNYGALVLKSGHDSPIFIGLCQFEELLSLLAGAYRERELGINGLYQDGVCDSLYNMIWKPIEEYTRDVKTIYVSPCLNMQNINLGYLKRPDGRYMNEKYNIQIVSSIKSILNRTDSINLKSAAIYGGIDYGTKEDVYASILRSSILETENERSGYGFLQGTLDEMDSISSLLANQNVTFVSHRGIAATEESFREFDKKSPSIIHIATHGYFYTDESAPSYLKSRIPYSTTDNSMLYSGLLFAGANNVNNTTNSRNDGVLTAEEISWMNLSNTELVTLSACLTSWGISQQEGFGGLIKAFKSAGVRYIVSSLWDVPDKPTAKLMTLFYKNLFAGIEIHDALLFAQRELAKEYPDPYYWASFIILD